VEVTFDFLTLESIDEDFKENDYGNLQGNDSLRVRHLFLYSRVGKQMIICFYLFQIGLHTNQLL